VKYTKLSGFNPPETNIPFGGIDIRDCMRQAADQGEPVQFDVGSDVTLAVSNVGEVGATPGVMPDMYRGKIVGFWDHR